VGIREGVSTHIRKAVEIYLFMRRL